MRSQSSRKEIPRCENFFLLFPSSSVSQDEDTFIGPLIAESEAIRIENWVNEAVADGAQIALGGKREGAFYDATILENVKPTARVYRDEAFGPVLIIEPYTHFADAVDKVNDSEFGLQVNVTHALCFH